MAATAASVPSAVRRAAVLGSPIAHSLSPVLHRAAYAALGLDWVYDARECDAERLPAVLAQVRADPAWVGLSLTMPCKLAAVGLVDRLAPLARQVGAVNTVVRAADATLSGHNTDVAGVTAALAEVWPTDAPPAVRVVVLGAGGSARAVLAALAADGGATVGDGNLDAGHGAPTRGGGSGVAHRTAGGGSGDAHRTAGGGSGDAHRTAGGGHGAPATGGGSGDADGTAGGGIGGAGMTAGRQVVLAVRDPGRAQPALALAAALGLPATAEPLTPFVLDGADLVVSTVPAGAADLLAASPWPDRTPLVDLLYHPWPTPLAQSAARAGARVAGGLAVLVGQAVGQVALMTGRRVPPAVLRRAAEEAAGQRPG